MLFQKCAWADRDVCVQWVNKVLEPAFSMYHYHIVIILIIVTESSTKTERLLILDSLDGQTTDKFKEALAKVVVIMKVVLLIII